MENTLQAWNLCGINEREQASRPTQTHNWERQRHCQRYDLRPDPSLTMQDKIRTRSFKALLPSMHLTEAIPDPSIGNAPPMISCPGT